MKFVLKEIATRAGMSAGKKMGYVNNFTKVEWVHGRINTVLRIHQSVERIKNVYCVHTHHRRQPHLPIFACYISIIVNCN